MELQHYCLPDRLSTPSLKLKCLALALLSVASVQALFSCKPKDSSSPAQDEKKTSLGAVDSCPFPRVTHIPSIPFTPTTTLDPGEGK